jgi:release factor glutamine methyltransferase
MWNIREALTWGIGQLKATQGEGASLDTQILLAFVLDCERTRLFLDPDRQLTEGQEEAYRRLLARRQRAEPIAYILGRKAFYGLDFLVDRRVLIPRPETEILVEAALKEIEQRLARGQMPVVADIGTGSGIIPITIAVEAPQLEKIYACDISPAALEVARENSRRHGVQDRVHLREGDLVAPLPEAVDILTANLPYVGLVERSEMTEDVVDYEPETALFSGPDGLDLLRRFCKEVQQFDRLRPGAVMLLEIGYRQKEALTQWLLQLWPQARIACLQDYAGWDRHLVVEVEGS